MSDQEPHALLASLRRNVREYLGLLSAAAALATLALSGQKGNATVGSYWIPVVLCVVTGFFFAPNLWALVTRRRKRPDYRFRGAVLLKEGWPHVSCRITTFQLILERVLQMARTPGTEPADALRSLGRDVAASFMVQAWRPMYERLERRSRDQEYGAGSVIPQLVAEKRVRSWALMEGSAGWGQFRFDQLWVDEKSIRATLVITSNFLASGRGDTAPSLCPFLEGYVSYIMTFLTGRRCQVTEQSCGKDNPADPNCVFRIA